jgi:hypothetical protein
MPFLAEEHISVPNKDLLSWMFDNQIYDQDVPVRDWPSGYKYYSSANMCRFTSTPQIQNAPSTHDKLETSQTNYVPDLHQLG